MVRDEDLAEAVSWMVRLNRDASQAGTASGVKAATDVTGYSLLGHALEISEASRVGLQIQFDRLPFLQSAQTYASQFIFPGGAYDNRAYFQQHVVLECEIGEDMQMLLYDPQTSGGLLMAVPVDRTDDFESFMVAKNAPFWQVGEVITGSGIIIT